MEPDSLPSWFMLFVGSWNEASVAYPSHGTTSPRHRRSHLRLVGLLSRTEGLSTAYSRERERLDRRFDEIFGRRYPEHYGLNLALQQFCTYKQELLRVLDAPQVPLHTNAAESDIRECLLGAKLAAEPAMTMVVEPAIPLRD